MNAKLIIHSLKKRNLAVPKIKGILFSFGISKNS